MADIVFKEIPLLDEIEEDGAPKKGSKKRMSVERIYQKKTQLEHILIRPDSYIGSVEKLTQEMWVMDEENNQMVQRQLTFVPGLYKIYDEILVNAADNKQRDPTMTLIKIDIKPEKNMIRIWNNGKGIPVVQHKVEKMFVPSLIFGHLLTSSNYDDSEKKVTGGRNGYGAKLCNIFSTEFTVETSCKEYNKRFKQTWKDNMTKTTEPSILSSEPSDFTSITFHPDLKKFKMEELDEDTVALFRRRAYDIAAATRGVRVFLNGKRLPINTFKDYVELYLKDKVDDSGNPLKVVHEIVNDRWEVAIAPSASGFQQVSFVNSISTTKGGRHVDYVSEQCLSKLMEVVKKKSGKTGVTIKAFQIKTHLWMFVNCLVENPTFDSQTKENMTLQAKSFGSKCALSDKFVTQVSKCGIVESIMSWMKFKAMEKMDKQCHKAKHSKLKGIPKLDDANEAGGKNSHMCTLILTEGDSAKSLAVAGLGVIGRDRFGVFPLRGKMLNVREAAHKQILENAEINNLLKILGLQYKNKYESPDSLKTLRYGKVMIMTDQDQDGSHIKGLVINFVHHNWPALLRHNFLEEFITPIVKVFKAKTERSFYSLPEFEEWQKETPNWHSYRVKYYKGLGTSSSKEAKEYFSDMVRHKIRFRYGGPDDDNFITLAFAKNKADERKDWLSQWMEEKRRRVELGLPELYLYGKDTKAISFNDFVNRELILFSNMDNERSIPCLVDGFKPGQRKVLFTCFKRNLVKELKVAQLAGSVAEVSSYHHGEVSLMGTIIGLAQDFIGSNNLNLLVPSGQFGTRLNGGKDAASPRYIFTFLSPLARIIFNANDEPNLKTLFDDNQRIEPEWYMPIIPMVLVNGAEGIGTGWSTRIPNYDVRTVVANLRRMIRSEEPKPMLPSYRHFKGVIQEMDQNRYMIHGEISILDEETVEITELPVRTWTQNYKEQVLEPMLNGTEKIQAVLQDYKEYHTDSTVRFVVKMTPERLARAEDQGLHKFFKLSTPLTSNSMVLFDHMGCVKRYSDVLDIMRDFYDLRSVYYDKRKEYMEGMLSAESLKLENQARFVLEHIQKKITINDKPKKVLIEMLVTEGYDSDPVKAWKESRDKMSAYEEQGEVEEKEAEESGPDFHYILNMPLWSLSRERKDDLLSQRDKKQGELRTLRSKTPSDLWIEDLDKLIEEMDKIEATERADKATADSKAKGEVSKAGGRVAKVKKHSKETMPSPMGRRVEPRIDEETKKKMELERKRIEKAKGAKAPTNGQKKLDEYLVNGAAEEVDSDSDSVDTRPLAERLSAAGLKVSPQLQGKATGEQSKRGLHFISTGKEAKAKSSAEGSSGGTKRGKRPAGGAAKTTPKKKARKRKEAWNSDESVKSISSGSDDDFGFGDSVPKEPLRERIPRRQTAVKATYVFDEDEEDQEFHAVDHGQGDREIQALSSDNEEAKKEDSDSDFAPVDSKSKDEEEKRLDSDSDFAPVVSKEEGKEKKKMRKLGPAVAAAPRGRGRGRGRGGATRGGGPAKKKTPTKKKDWGSSDNDDSDSDFGAKKKPSPAKKKTVAKKKKQWGGSSDNDDSDSDFGAKKKPRPAKKKTVAKKKKNDWGSSAESDGSDIEAKKTSVPAKKKSYLDSDDNGAKKVDTVEMKKKDDDPWGLLGSDNSDSEVVPQKKDVPAKKKDPFVIPDSDDDREAEVMPKKRFTVSDSSEEEIKKKSNPPKKKKRSSSVSDEEVPPPKSKAARLPRRQAAAKVTYAFDDDDDDSVKLSDASEESPMKPVTKKKRKAISSDDDFKIDSD